MAGPNMEVFRFGFYLFFPIFAMYKFGDPVWFETYVQPYKDYLLPSYEESLKPPKTTAALHEELARLKAERRSKLGSGSSETVGVVPVDQANPVIPTSASTSAVPSRILEAIGKDQALGSSSNEIGAGEASGSRWGWGSSQGSSGSGRLV